MQCPLSKRHFIFQTVVLFFVFLFSYDNQSFFFFISKFWKTLTQKEKQKLVKFTPGKKIQIFLNFFVKK